MLDLLLSRFSQTPALAAQNKADRFTACLRAFSGHPDSAKLMVEPSMAVDDFWPDPASWKAAYRPYVVQNGVLTVPIQGVLLNNFGWAISDWMTGYQYIQKALERGMQDSNVKGIVLMVDSPGGEVAGNFDLADRIYGMRGQKPLVAIASESAYSAAYSLASSTDSITVTRTGGVGSVGVVTSHVDRSEQLNQAGLKVTFIFAGKHKVDGNSYEPLPADVEARIQTTIDGIYDVFTGIVGRNRGMNVSDVKATEALTYGAQDAVDVGFADNVGAADTTLAAFAKQVNKTGVSHMSGNTENKPEAATAEQIRAAHAEGVQVGAKSERERIKSIQACDEAKGREEMATHLAMNTSMNLEDAKGILAASPKKVEEASAATGKTAFELAMEKENPEVGAGGGGEKPNAAQTILSAYVKSGGIIKATKGAAK